MPCKSYWSFLHATRHTRTDIARLHALQVPLGFWNMGTLFEQQIYILARGGGTEAGVSCILGECDVLGPRRWLARS